MLVVRNDWTAYHPPTIGDWTPSARVSVIVPAYRSRSLSKALSALAGQSYPQSLLDVVVVGQHGFEPSPLPSARPAQTSVVRAEEPGHGAVVRAGAAASTGSIIVSLAPEEIPTPTYVEALVRWPLQAGELVAVGRGAANAALIDRTQSLRSAGPLAYQAMSGATFATSRFLYDAVGGVDVDLRDDAVLELGYRLAQRGVVFVAEEGVAGSDEPPDDPPPPVVRAEALLAARVPDVSRRGGGRGEHAGSRVPLATVIVFAEDSPETTPRCVDLLLASDTSDFDVIVVAGPHQVHVSPDLVGRYAGNSRVRFVAEAPPMPYASPLLLRVPARLGVGPGTVRRLCESAHEWRVGLVHVVPAGAAVASPAIELWRTGAVARVRWHETGQVADPLADPLPHWGNEATLLGEEIDFAAGVARVYGERWVSGADFEVRDLAEPSRGPTRAAGRPRRAYEVVGQNRRTTNRVQALLSDPGPVGRRYARAVLRRIRRAIPRPVRRTG